MLVQAVASLAPGARDITAPAAQRPASRRPWALGLARPRRGSSGGNGRPRPLRRPGAVEQTEATTDFVVIPWDASRETWDDESAKRMADLMRKFEAADKDGNGVIDRDELRALLERVGNGEDEVPMSWLSEEDLEEVMAQYDKNGDGVISFEEFAQMSQDNIFLTGKLQEYQAAFRGVDAGGNGSISATELYQLFQKLEHPITYERLVSIMESYDRDQSGVIDFGEFLRMFRNELLDLNEIVDYLKKRTAHREAAAAAKAAAKAAAAAPAAAAPAAPAPVAAPAPELLPGAVTLFFGEEELDAILAANPGRLVVLMASVTWCRPCRAFQETYEEAAKHYSDALFLKFYGNSNESTKGLFKERLKARTTPSFFFLADGQIVERCTGAVASRFETHLRRAYSKQGTVPHRLWLEEQ